MPYRSSLCGRLLLRLSCLVSARTRAALGLRFPAAADRTKSAPPLQPVATAIPASAAAALALSIVLGVTLAAPTAAAGDVPSPSDLEGRWTWDGDPSVVIDIGRCEERMCGKRVTEGRCGPVVLDFDAKPREMKLGVVAFTGGIDLDERWRISPIMIVNLAPRRLTIYGPEAYGPARRILPLIELVRTGPPACPAGPSS